MHLVDTQSPRRLSTLWTLALAAPLLFGSLNASALSSLPTSGTCAFIGSFQYPFAYTYGQDPGSGWGLNVMATLNFETKAIAGNVVQINPNPNTRPLQSQQQTSFSGTFAVSNGPIPNSHLLSTTIKFAGQSTAGPGFKWNVIPVNGGNTLLVQLAPMPPESSDGGMAGVCQF